MKNLLLSIILFIPLFISAQISELKEYNIYLNYQTVEVVEVVPEPVYFGDDVNIFSLLNILDIANIFYISGYIFDETRFYFQGQKKELLLL